MSRRTKNEDEPIGKFRVVRDTLPSPEELVFRERSVKVTLNLKHTSVDFFKELGRTHGTPYQKIIRDLLDHYAKRNSRE